MNRACNRCCGFREHAATTTLARSGDRTEALSIAARVFARDEPQVARELSGPFEATPIDELRRHTIADGDRVLVHIHPEMDDKASQPGSTAGDDMGWSLHADGSKTITESKDRTVRRLLGLLAAYSCLLGGATAASASHAESDFKVTLLGTASPAPRVDRFGPSTLVEAGDQKLLFDTRRGVPIRLRQLSVPLGKINVLFLTHYHSDHTSGIPDVWLTGWLPTPFGRRTTPFHVIGPVGAKAIMSNLERAYALDIKIRLEDEQLPPAGIATIAEEFDKGGIVYDKDGVKVIAFTVDHGRAITPAVGYRIEYGGRSVVISGDTRYDQNVIKYGAGADVLIHEVASARPELLASSVSVQRIMAHHTTPKEAGMVFSQTKPKMAVYTHIVFLSNDKLPEPTLDEVVRETRQTYSGPLVVGEDLTSFEIGETVTVRRYKP